MTAPGVSVVAVPGPDPVMGVCVAQLSVGVLGRSRKENERRLAIHPRHLDRIEASLRGSVYLEQGYGERFGIPDEQLTGQVAGLRSRDGLLADCEVIMLPKPLPEDLQQLREGQVLWGWPHCVQNSGITQLAIDRRLTLIAFEAMHHWSGDGSFHLHVFHKNNELAGYCSVLHAMQLIGSTGEYGRPLRAAVISFGAAGRGAVTALQALGVAGIHILTHRDVTAVASPGPPARIVHFERDPADPARCQVLGGGGPVPMAAYLAGFDIVANCVLQDTGAPLMFVTRNELPLFSPGTLIIDVSCDTGMGFSWAQPTSFADPMVTVGDSIYYYAVDHSPSLLWNSATWEISEALLPYLPTVLGGPAAWDSDETIRRAIEIREGVIQNPAILSFQHRAPRYPHPRLR
jgi:alanine dehydrogenase